MHLSKSPFSPEDGKESMRQIGFSRKGQYVLLAIYPNSHATTQGPICYSSRRSILFGPTCDMCSKREIIGVDLMRKYRLCHCGMITSGNQLVRQSEDPFQGCWFQLLHELLLNGFGFEIIDMTIPATVWMVGCSSAQPCNRLLPLPA